MAAQSPTGPAPSKGAPWPLRGPLSLSGLPGLCRLQDGHGSEGLGGAHAGPRVVHRGGGLDRGQGGA